MFDIKQYAVMRNDLILFTIGRISERAKIFLTGELRERGMGELGVSHTEILGILTRRERVQMKDLVELIGKDKSTITALAAKLLRMGLVRKTADPEDSRVSYLSLTAKGRELEAPIMAISRRLREKAYRGLSENERKELIRLLAKIQGNF